MPHFSVSGLNLLNPCTHNPFPSPVTKIFNGYQREAFSPLATICFGLRREFLPTGLNWKTYFFKIRFDINLITINVYHWYTISLAENISITEIFTEKDLNNFGPSCAKWKMQQEYLISIHDLKSQLNSFSQIWVYSPFSFNKLHKLHPLQITNFNYSFFYQKCPLFPSLQTANFNPFLAINRYISCPHRITLL